MIIPSLDGKTYDVDNSSGSLYCTAGVRTSSEKTTDGDHEVITTVIENQMGKIFQAGMKALRFILSTSAMLTVQKVLRTEKL